MNSPRRALRLTFSLGLLLVVLAGFWQKQNIYDWWKLRGYDPPLSIAQLATDTTMKEDARRTFYIYQPELNNKQEFNQNCGTHAHEHTIVLGCYLKNKGIYLLDVTDPRLNGVEEVTAAHELLHAKYDRLKRSERERIDKLVNQAYASVTDERIRKTVDEYRSAGAEVTNELHSILGTEVRELPAELEDYYGRYFSNRQKIVGYSESYQAAFTERKDRVALYDAQLNDLKAQIDENQSELNQLSAALNAEREQVENSGSQSAVDAFNRKVRQYNNLVTATKELIERYNQIVTERNQIALEEQELFDAINSNSQDTVPAR